MEMTNRELYKKILYELGNEYKIGLHESTKFKYNFRKNFDEIYDINDSTVNEEQIILNILKKGLCISDRTVGLKSTITFLNKIKVDSFNYSYYRDLGNDKVYNLVVAIPKKIEIDRFRYYISDMIDNGDMINYSLFNTLLPREFIYGYYIKNIKCKEQASDEDDIYREGALDDKIDFYLNDKFYGYMDNDIQRKFWINYFNDYNIDLDLCSNVSKKRVRK